MRKITIQDQLLAETQVGWVGDDAHIALSDAQLDALVTAAKIPRETEVEFKKEIARTHLLFDKLANRQVDITADSSQKVVSILDAQKVGIEKALTQLLEKLHAADANGLFSIVARPTNEVGTHELCRRVMHDLENLQSLCEEIEIELKTGPDNNLQKYFIERLAGIYEFYASRKAGISKNTTGKTTGPFVRLVKMFFECQNKKLLDGLGIAPATVSKILQNVLKERKSNKNK